MLISPAFCEGIDFTEFDERVGDALGIGEFAGGLLLSVLLLVIVFGVVGIVSKRKPNDSHVLFLGFVVLSACIGIGWFPVWSVVFLILFVALLFGSKVIKGVK